ncbi:hypothetical protein [Paracoccus sp. M683]|uniref:hypothetical protein n=1 Tax=Paracoccus sp. M683 TaxID=2594268 RepID=UPI002106497E|nr:hypothetical protein [Paracoccus sp. M683]
MALAAVARHGDDPILGQAEIGDPAADMFARRPALPPAGEAGVGFEPQRVEQLPEKLFKSIIARSVSVACAPPSAFSRDLRFRA